MWDWKIIHALVENEKNVVRLRPIIQLGLQPLWIWDAEALYFPVFHSRLCDNLK